MENEIWVKELENKIHNILKIELEANNLHRYEETKLTIKLETKSESSGKSETEKLWTKSEQEYFFEILGAKQTYKKIQAWRRNHQDLNLDSNVQKNITLGFS